MTPKNKEEQKGSEARRERDQALRVEGAEQAFEAFREALGAVTTGDEADVIREGFDETLALARALGRDEGREEERRRKKLYMATLTYGAGKMVQFGPTTSRDRADALANSWMEGHAGITSKGEVVKGVKIDEVDSSGVKVSGDDEEDP